MRTTAKARMLLLELVFNLFIFAVCALVCVSLFVQSRKMSRESTDLTQAVYLAQSAAELWKSGGTPNTTSGNYNIVFTNMKEQDGLRTCTISVSRDEQVMYVLEGVTAPCR